MPFKKFLRDKATYSADEIAVDCDGEKFSWWDIYAIQKLGAIAVLVNFNLCVKEIAALIDYAYATHFCYGEMHDLIQRDRDFRTRLNEYARRQNLHDSAVLPHLRARRGNFRKRNGGFDDLPAEGYSHEHNFGFGFA